MAAKIVTPTEKADRQDTFRVHPSDAKPGKNSRMIENPNYPAKVQSLAIDIFINGQIQPAVVRRNADKTLELVAGYTRHDAVELLRAGFDAIHPGTGEPMKFHDPEAKLWVKVEDMSDEEAFTTSLAENIKRNDTTDTQEALAQQELRDKFGWNDARIARFYGYTNQNRVSQLRKLLKLGKKTQEKVHAGDLSLYAALATDKMDEAARNDLLDACANPQGKIDVNALKDALRASQEKVADQGGTTGEGGEGEGEEEGDETPSNLKRNVSDFKKFAAEVAQDESIDEGAKELFVKLTKWFAGKIGQRAVLNSLETLRSKK
jgi:ParB-like chromosome segregation protein Spo0J